MSQEEKELAEKLGQEWASGRAYLGVESTGDDIESEAEWSHQPLGKVLFAAAKATRLCTWSK